MDALVEFLIRLAQDPELAARVASARPLDQLDPTLSAMERAIFATRDSRTIRAALAGELALSGSSRTVSM